MSDDSRKTLKFNAPSGTEGQIDTLRGLIPADWQPVEGAKERVLEADLGTDLPTLRLEESDGKWVGSFTTPHSEEAVRTEECDSHNTAALHLRERLASYGKAVKERAERILEIAQSQE